MKHNLLLITICFAAHFCLVGQSVWPGDVNNNGVVNAVDLLFWGVAYGAEGPARDMPSSDWSAQTFPEAWGQDFPNGLNYAYADCNGDGIVDEDDFDDAIEDNFGEDNPPIGSDQYVNASAGNAPSFRLTPSATLVQEGAMVSIDLSIDDSQMMLDSFYGVALQLSYTTGLLEGDDGPDFELQEDSWLEGDDSYVQELYADEDGMGTAQLAITRTNQQSIAAQAGTIGRFDLIVEDIIVGLEVDTFILRIDSVFLINDRMMVVPVVPDTTQIIIARDTSKLSTSVWEGANILPSLNVFPNPTKNQVMIQSEIPMYQFRLLGPAGNAWLEENLSSPVFNRRLRLEGLPPGVYWLQALTDYGVLSKRLVVISP